MNKRTIVTFAMIMTLCLSAVGFAYAHWADYVTVSGEIDVNSLNLAWIWNDVEEPYYSDNECEFKDFGDGDWEYQDREVDCYTEDVGYETMVFKMWNVYPGYYGQFKSVPLGNIGTTAIDLDMSRLVISGKEYGETTNDLKFKWIVAPPATQAYGVLYHDMDGDDEIDPETDDFPGEEKIWIFTTFFRAGRTGRPQIPPGLWIKEEIDFYFLQPIYECTEYEIYIKIVGVQWNWEGVEYQFPLPDPN